MFRSDWILARHGPLMLIPLLWLMAAMATTYPKFKSLKSFRQNPRMLRGQQVETASYSVEFEPHGSCKVLRACDPPCEITFPGWSRRSRPGMRSPMAVEAIKAICASDLMDGSHPVLFARAVIVPNAPFQKLLAVANLRKLLKTHLPENFKNVMEAGSTLYRLDVDGSDHDIEVVFKNIPDDQQIVDLLLAGMTAAQLDAQQRVSGFKTKSKDYHELAAARSFSEIILRVEVEWQSHHGFSFESCLRQYLWGVQTAYIRMDMHGPSILFFWHAQLGPSWYLHTCLSRWIIYTVSDTFFGAILCIRCISVRVCRLYYPLILIWSLWNQPLKSYGALKSVGPWGFLGLPTSSQVIVRSDDITRKHSSYGKSLYINRFSMKSRLVRISAYTLFPKQVFFDFLFKTSEPRVRFWSFWLRSADLWISQRHPMGCCSNKVGQPHSSQLCPSLHCHHGEYRKKKGKRIPEDAGETSKSSRNHFTSGVLFLSVCLIRSCQEM